MGHLSQKAWLSGHRLGTMRSSTSVRSVNPKVSPAITLAAKRSTPPTEVSILTEVSDLCNSLEDRLQAALASAAGDASRVVLVLDLDETCFTPLTDDGLATTAWFEDILARWAPKLEKSEGLSFEETLEAVHVLARAFYSRIAVRPTEEGLSALLQKYKALGVASIGLTSRRPFIAGATWAQMQRTCNLEFDSLASPLDADRLRFLEEALRAGTYGAPTPTNWAGISFERGVWFTSGANKGAVLRIVLDAGKHVIFADDTLSHVQSVASALFDHAASVSSLHFTTASADAKRRVIGGNVDRSLAHHFAALFAEKDPIVVALVQKRNALLRGLIAEQMDAISPQVDPALQNLASALGS